MTAKEIKAKIFPATGYRSRLLSYPALLTATVAELLWLAMNSDLTGYDTLMYIWAADSYATDYLDILRPPVYPLLIIASRAVVGSGPGILYPFICAIQALVMLVSAWYFRATAQKIIGCGERGAFWTTAAYCLLPAVQWHTVSVMTESLAISGTVIMTYWMVRDLPGRVSVRAGLMTMLWLTFLIFLRPMLLCMIPVVGLWLIIQSVRRSSRGRGVAAGWCGLLGCLIAVGAFTALMHKTYGIHTFSGVSVINNFRAVSDAGVIYPHHTDNMALRTNLSRIYGRSELVNYNPMYIITYEIPDVTDSVSMADIEALTKRAAMERPGQVAAHLWRRVWWTARTHRILTYTNIRGVVSLEEILLPNFLQYGIFMLVYPLWLLNRRHRRERRLLWLPWSICMIVALAALVGAMDSWSRLIVPSVPCLIILVAAPLSRLRYNPRQIL